MHHFSPKNRFFDPLVAFLASHIGVSIALVVQRRQQLPSLDGKFGGLAAPAAVTTLWYEILPLIATLERGGWPDTVNYTEEPGTAPADLPKELISGTGRVHALAAQAMFVQYSDGVADLMNKRQQDPIVRFATKVRNAGAHGGRIEMDPKSPPVAWRSVTLTPADHGKRLLTGDIKAPGGGLTAGDLVVLMRDLDAAI